MPPTALSPKQLTFVGEYLLDLNATAAARRAGYSASSCNKIGSELLDKTRIQVAIAEAQAARAARTAISADRILLEYARVGLADLTTLLDTNGAVLPVPQWPHDLRPAVVGFTSKALYEDVDGAQTLVGYLQTVKLADKVKALDSLAKHLGLFATHSEGNEISELLKAVLLGVAACEQKRSGLQTATLSDQRSLQTREPLG
jgi:phage terminase small subunit